MPLRSYLFAGLVLIFLSMEGSAQEFEEEYEEPASPMGVLIGVKGGIVVSTPRQVFPSLRVGESLRGTGEISSRYAESGLGYRYGLELLIPFNERIALTTEGALHTYVARYEGDTGRPAVRLDVQIVQVGGGVAGNLYHNKSAFDDVGLRNVYVAGGLDIGVKTVANRLEAFAYPDSTGTPQPAVGSFDNNEPFRTLIGLHFAGGVRYGFDTHMELLAEASYSFALNAIFSGTVVRDNSFTVDNLAVQIGIGHRF